MQIQNRCITRQAAQRSARSPGLARPDERRHLSLISHQPLVSALSPGWFLPTHLQHGDVKTRDGNPLLHRVVGKESPREVHIICLLLLLLLSRFRRVPLCATLWTAAHQAPPSMELPRQKYWSGLPFPSPHWSISSVQFSRSVMSNSLRPHELQHTRPLCLSPTPGIHPNSCPSSR